MNFIPITEREKGDMLKKIGVERVEKLFEGVEPKLNRTLNLTPPMNELELKKHMENLSKKNKICRYFIGAGAYHHYIPSAVNHILLRSEFYTSYTPYQAEVSQGMLQAIYEFQTYICLLTGMDVANASVYDGATALAEGISIAANFTKRNEIVLLDGIHPHYVETVRTYCNARDLILKEEISNSTACVVVQNPNFYGNIEDLAEIEKKAHAVGALFIVCVVEPTSLALLKPPSEFKADIVVGEGQSFGNSLSYGGPHVGFIAVKNELVSKIPGRLCGMTVDTEGRSGFTLTLQAREQHIRRERATSNLCTNQALNAVAAAVYLSLLGASGLRKVAMLSYKQAHKLQEKLKEIGYEPINNKLFYNEFAVKCPTSPKKINKALLKKNILGGLDLGNNSMLLCCTEMTSDESIDEFINVLRGLH